RKPRAGAAKGYSHKEEAHPDGPSQIERGDIVEMDARAAKALRFALDDAVRGIALRFNLDYRVVRGEFGADGAVYKIGLEIKERPRPVHVTGNALLVPSDPPGKPLGSARLPRSRDAVV